MTAEEYIKAHPERQMFIIPKIFGDGKTLIKFFYRNQIQFFNQEFLAYVDSSRWEYEHHKVHEEVEKYLIENYGVIDIEDFEYKDGIIIYLMSFAPEGDALSIMKKAIVDEYTWITKEDIDVAFKSFNR